MNIKEPQILIHYPDDVNYQWHHRFLLERIAEGRCVTLTLDLDLQIHDFSRATHRVCERGDPFPAAAANIYAHDEIPSHEVDGYCRRAVMQAAILDDGPEAEAGAHVWLIADPAHKRFAMEVGEDAANGGAVLQNKGVIIIDGKEVWIEKVVLPEVEEWKKGRSDALRDLMYVLSGIIGNPRVRGIWS